MKISNFQFPISKKPTVPCTLNPVPSQKGFTIIEVLIVAGIFGVIGIIATDLLAKTFQGNNKVRLINVIQQNGQTALGNMEQTTKFAEDVICPTNSTLSPILVVVSNGVYTRYKITESPTNTITQDNPTSADVNDPNFCNVTAQVSPNPLINSTSIKITNSGFVVNDVSGGNKSVTIKFDLSSASADNSFDNQIPAVSFRNTIQLR